MLGFSTILRPNRKRSQCLHAWTPLKGIRLTSWLTHRIWIPRAFDFQKSPFVSLSSLQYEIQFVKLLMDNLSCSQKNLKVFRRQWNSKKCARLHFFYWSVCIERFATSAAIQCLCNAFFTYLFCFSSLNRWDSTDLDIILLNGDISYI